MIRLTDLSFRYSGERDFALKDVSLHIERGGFTGIIGAAGSGKTTLTRVINGLIPHRYTGDMYGEAVVGGMDTVECRPDMLSRIVGSVFQDIDGQMVTSVVEDEILFGLENFGVSDIAERLEWALETVGISELRYRAVSTLSGGQKQKVAIAAILALQPEVMVLDEPTGELDPVSSRHVFETLRELNEQYGITIIIVEQKIMLQCEFAKSLVVLDAGRVAFSGSVDEVLRHSDELQRLGVNAPRVVSLASELTKLGIAVDEPPRSVAGAERMVRGIVRTIEAFPVSEQMQKLKPSPNIEREAAVTFDNVFFTYADSTRCAAVNGVSFNICSGEIAAIVGANGAGKSTIARLADGLLKPTRGSVTVMGLDTLTARTSLLAKSVGFLFQNPDRQLCRKTVREEITFSLECACVNQSEIRKRVDETLERFGLAGERDPFGMSRGERQRVALAALAACRPKIMILDEPTTGLDYRECMHIMGIIREMNEAGATVIMVSHDMEVVSDFASRVLVMSGGTLIADGEANSVLCDRATLERASVLPPQIYDLALRLGGSFRDKLTVEDMVGAIIKEVK